MDERYVKILEYFGIESQLKKLVEEASEVLEAGTIYNMGGSEQSMLTKRGRLDHIVEEISDVEIVLEQLKMYYNITQGQIDDWKNKKIDRTINRIETDYYVTKE